MAKVKEEKLDFKETDTLTLYKLLRDKTNTLPLVAPCVFYIASPHNPEPLDSFQFQALKVSYGWFFGLIGKKLTIEALMENKRVKIVVANPVYMIDNHTQYYVATLVFGGMNVKISWY